MKVQSPDTTPEMEKLHLNLLRQAGPVRRTTMLRNLTASTRKMSWQTLIRSRPSLTLKEKRQLFVELLYGFKPGGMMEDQIRPARKKFEEDPREKLKMDADILGTILDVVEVLERSGINYLIGGSIASSVHGLPRSTQDIDLVADIKQEQVPELVAQLGTRYYLDENAIKDALKRQSSFNLIDQETLFKIDIFSLQNNPFSQKSFERRQDALIEDSSRSFKMYTPEDIVLQKLLWFQAGGGVSERQWLDILGILKMQEQLDWPYLEDWANRLNLDEQLKKAREEAYN